MKVKYSLPGEEINYSTVLGTKILSDTPPGKHSHPQVSRSAIQHEIFKFSFYFTGCE